MIRHRTSAPDGSAQHREWLDLIETGGGPFLSVPVLRRAWPTLDPLDKPARERLRHAHTAWAIDPAAGRDAWITYVLNDLLSWGDARHTDHMDVLAHEVPTYDTTTTPTFALVEPDEDVKPATTSLVGLVLEPGTIPTARIPGSEWAATPVDRLALLCRHHHIELGLVTDGRWWTLVWAPQDGTTSTATFDAMNWPEAAERVVVRAFVSLLTRTRFFAVPEDDRLPALLRTSLDSQEDITEALGVQVRHAVELLVAAIGRIEARERESGSATEQTDAHDVYRGAVVVMMRVVFLLFAEERGLLPADNELYTNAYSVGLLCAELEQRARAGSEHDLEHGTGAWHRLFATFTAVYWGVNHPRFRMHAHDGSLFSAAEHPWLPLNIDDRTVLHMLRAVQYIQVGTGRSRERRRLSFRTLDVEQIGYVYEGLLSFDAHRADDTVVGLIGKAGLEAEIALTELEEHAGRNPDVPSLAAALSTAYKDSKIGSPRALEKALAPHGAKERQEAIRRLLAVTGGDYPLAERLLPFDRLIRRDLRDLPTVVLPGALYVTESPLRRLTGTHYTPAKLAAEVVRNALEPLVFSPGPLQTADTSAWEPVSSERILSLKIADIAMGSAAFLVAACRYLAERLVEAWEREDRMDVLALRARTPLLPDAESDPVEIEARRQIIEHCLYGVDINPMAVEMAKISLWLVSMDPARPFTFLDDRLITGDSLLGITSLDQLEGHEADRGDLFGWLDGVRDLVRTVAQDRRRLIEIEGTDLAGLERKRRVLDEVAQRTERLRTLGDLQVGAELSVLTADVKTGADLAYAPRGARGGDLASLAAAHIAAGMRNGEIGQETATDQARRWLATDAPAGSMPRLPIHWPLAFPEVFENGGFDAIIGNPPFLGGKKITKPLGHAYREYLIESIGNGIRGHADLVAYFVLRSHTLLNHNGGTGLLATKTLAQGVTRQVCLDQITSQGITIYRSIKTRPWPSRSAALEYCAIWTSRNHLNAEAARIADDTPVSGITATLEPQSRTPGVPYRLAREKTSFIGSYVMGSGFVVSREWATETMAESPRNGEVLRPFLNGQDINEDPSCDARRWVINFHDWPEEKAREYLECYSRVTNDVKPYRMNQKDPHGRRYWWRFFRPRPELYHAIQNMSRVIVITLHTKALIPVMVPTGQVYSHALGVFSSEDTAMLALLSSAPHFWWAVTRGSGLGVSIRYTPSDVFETLPLPELTEEMRGVGDHLDKYRRDVMLSRDLGLTKTYNLANDPACRDDDIDELRRIHREIDIATVRAYGWDDLIPQLDHGFHPVARETRYTIGPKAQREVLDRLLELNHARYAEEVAAGLHDKRGVRPSVEPGGDGLFPVDGGGS